MKDVYREGDVSRGEVGQRHGRSPVKQLGLGNRAALCAGVHSGLPGSHFLPGVSWGQEHGDAREGLGISWTDCVSLPVSAPLNPTEEEGGESMLSQRDSRFGADIKTGKYSHAQIT